MPKLHVRAAARGGLVARRGEEQRFHAIGAGEHAAVVDERQRHHEASEQPAPEHDGRQHTHHRVVAVERRHVDGLVAEGLFEHPPPSPGVVRGRLGVAVDEHVPLRLADRSGASELVVSRVDSHRSLTRHTAAAWQAARSSRPASSIGREPC